MGSSTTSFTYSADYYYLEVALSARWLPLRELKSEMGAFRPRPASDWVSERRQEVERLQALNPGVSSAELAPIADQTIDYRASNETQFLARFEQRVWAEMLSALLLSHALCEALINAMLAIHLHRHGDAAAFRKREREPFMTKWNDVPKLFATDFNLPSHVTLHRTLETLSTWRKAIGHYKVRLESSGATILGGSEFRMPPLDECVAWAERFLRLPFELKDLVDRHVGHGMFLGLLHEPPRDNSPNP